MSTIVFIAVMCWAANSHPEVSAVSLTFPERIEARGQTRLRLERAYDRLCSPPLDDADFVLSDVSFRLPRRFTMFSGDISGRMLGALQAAGPILGRDTPRVAALAEAFAGYQKADGHLGADQNLAAGVQQERDMPILWGNGRLLLALAERYRLTKDPRALAVARKIGDYAISTRPLYGKKENFEQVGGVYATGYTTCYPSLIDGLVALGEVSGDRRFPEEAGFISQLSLLDRGFEKHHSHGRLTAYRGMLDLDRLTGKSEFLDAVRAGYETIRKGYQLPSGGIPEILDRAYPRDEGCSEADWIRVSFLLWQATGQMSYLDAAEGALRNHLMASQYPNGGFGHHLWRTLSDGKESYPAGGIANYGAEAYWCCSMHGTQVLADVAGWGAMVSQDKVLITWLSEVRSAVRIGEKSLTITTTQVEPGTWDVLLDSPLPAEATLCLRVPGWADALTIDGRAHRGDHGWVDLPCRWSGSLIMKVTLPDRIRLAGIYEPQPKEAEPVRVFAGPDLFCLPDVDLGQGLSADDTVPRLVMDAGRPEGGGEIPVVVENAPGGARAARLVRMADRPPGGCRFLFHVRRESTDAFHKLLASVPSPPEPGPVVEACIACDGEYETYLNGKMIFRGGGIGDISRVEAGAKRGTNVVAIRARSGAKRPGLIGVIRADNRILVKTADDWSTAACPDTMPADWLKDIGQGPKETLKLNDLGGFGAAPWNYEPGEYANTGARWVWPQESSPPSKRWWLLRYRFELP